MFFHENSDNGEEDEASVCAENEAGIKMKNKNRINFDYT